MKHIITCIILLVCLGKAVAQESPMQEVPVQEAPANEDGYYTPPTGIPHIRKPDPKKMRAQIHHQVKIQSRWYTGIDIFGRSDQSTLDNNYNYLLFPASALDIGFSGQVGWVFREQWSVEGGYGRTKIHNMAKLNTTNKGSFRFSNSGNALFLRTKFLLDFNRMGYRRPGIWIGGGGWAVPNHGGTRNSLGYRIYHYNGFGRPSDTTYVTSKTTISDQWTYGLEASAEYCLKINEWLDMAVFLRRYWGAGTAITTELTYSDNRDIQGKGYIKSDGTGWNFGLSFRFVSGIRRGSAGNDPDNLMQKAPEQIIIGR